MRHKPKFVSKFSVARIAVGLDRYTFTEYAILPKKVKGLYKTSEVRHTVDTDNRKELHEQVTVWADEPFTVFLRTCSKGEGFPKDGGVMIVAAWEAADED